MDQQPQNQPSNIVETQQQQNNNTNTNNQTQSKPLQPLQQQMGNSENIQSKEEVQQQAQIQPVQQVQQVQEVNSQSIENQQQNPEKNNITQKQNEEEKKKLEEKKQEIDLCSNPLLIDQQINLIQQEVEMNQPMVSEIQGIEVLEKEFENNKIFKEKIALIKNQYPNIRTVRRDGRCFYKSYLFSIFERIVKYNDIALQKAVLNKITKSKQDLIKVGYEEFVLDDFYDMMIDKLKMLQNEDFTIDQLNSIFCDKLTCDSLIMYLRFMTSGFLKANKEIYQCYLDNFLTIEEYCAQEVDPIDRDADQITILALINYLEVPINILYLDQNTKPMKPQVLTYPESTSQDQIFINLLYRPGHYDILYKC